jgi:hypothetical protein
LAKFPAVIEQKLAHKRRLRWLFSERSSAGLIESGVAEWFGGETVQRCSELGGAEMTGVAGTDQRAGGEISLIPVSAYACDVDYEMFCRIFQRG